MNKESKTTIANEESMESRLEQILNDALIKATDTYSVPPQIIWVDNSTIATLGNFSASTGKAKAKRHSTYLPWWQPPFPMVPY